MKNLIYVLIFIIIISCTSEKKVYWCGDHPCINDKERKAYFEKNMSVEVKKLNKNDKKKMTDMEKIIEQAKIDEKNRIKDEKNLAKKEKLAQKNKLEEEKELTKQLKLEEKQRKKEEKALAKQLKLEERKKKKEKKALTKKLNIIEKKSSDNDINRVEINKPVKKVKKIEKGETSDFYRIVERIVNENKSKSYPDINNLPE